MSETYLHVLKKESTFCAKLFRPRGPSLCSTVLLPWSSSSDLSPFSGMLCSSPESFGCLVWFFDQSLKSLQSANQRETIRYSLSVTIRWQTCAQTFLVGRSGVGPMIRDDGLKLKQSLIRSKQNVPRITSSKRLYTDPTGTWKFQAQ